MGVASYDRQRALASAYCSPLKRVALPSSQRRPTPRSTPTRWARRELETARWHGYSERTAEAICPRSAVGIALACIADADDRLRAPFEAAIEDAEAVRVAEPVRDEELVLA